MPSWTYPVLTSSSHLLRVCRSFTGCDLSPYLLIHPFLQQMPSHEKPWVSHTILCKEESHKTFIVLKQMSETKQKPSDVFHHWQKQERKGGRLVPVQWLRLRLPVQGHGSIPDPRRFHMLQLLKPAWPTVRALQQQSLPRATKGSPCTLQLDKALGQYRRPSAVSKSIKKYKKCLLKTLTNTLTFWRQAEAVLKVPHRSSRVWCI